MNLERFVSIFLATLLLINIRGIKGRNEGGRIIGGQHAQPHQFPFQISINNGYNIHGHFCSGSIINKLFVLTATHCLNAPDFNNRAFIIAGAHDLSYEDNEKEQRQIRTISKYIMHSGYDGKSHDNDIALIKLNETLKFNKFVGSAKLISGNESISGEATVSGWGATENSDRAPILLRVNVDIIDKEKCVLQYANIGHPVSENMICAGKLGIGKKDSCQADSGGPLMCVNDQFLCGIVSHGKECGHKDYPGVYADVSKYLKWIETNMKENEIIDGIVKNVLPKSNDPPVTTTESSKNTESNDGSKNGKNGSERKSSSYCITLIVIVFILTFFIQITEQVQFGKSYNNNNEILNSTSILNDNQINPKVYGGEETKPNEFPFQVFIRGGGILCGGTILDEWTILTARHCSEKYDNKIDSVEVWAGTHNIDAEEQNRQLRKISKIINHEKYKTYDNDISLLKMTKKLTFNNFVKAAKLPAIERSDPKAGEKAIGLGWGLINKDEASKVLKKVTLDIYDTTLCKKVYVDSNIPFTENMFCTYTAGQDVCTGDSGGALVCKDDQGGDYQCGIVSFGISPCGTQANVYTKLSNYLTWIKDKNVNDQKKEEESTTISGTSPANSGNTLNRANNKNSETETGSRNYKLSDQLKSVIFSNEMLIIIVLLLNFYTYYK